MRPVDTTDEAHQVQMAAYRSMSADQRTELAIEMSEDIRSVTVEGLRERHVGATDSEIGLLLVELWHGPELAALVRASGVGQTSSPPG